MADLQAQLQSGLAGQYTLERELGRGGMATVFLAQDLKHKRPVALKVLLPELAHSLGPDRFHREIEIAARLQHPHILTIHDSGETAGQLWFTMPYVEGESLRTRLTRERQLPVEDALRIACEAAQALQYAHEHGVIHRDIKPENLLLTRDGNTLVADFGIARALGSGDEQLTQTGMAVGTPAYMSPEQAAGERTLDARTDIYSLAVVLYEMLAGEPPYTGATAQAILARRFSEAPRPLRILRDTIPDPIDQAVQKALAKAPADRFATAAQFAQALTLSVTTPTVTPTIVPPVAPTQPAPSPASPARGIPRRVPIGLATLGIGFVFGLGVLFAWRRVHHAGDVEGPRLLAVLPFENLGAPEDEYFADGIADEVRTKLSTMPGMEVIARGSSTSYKRTTKTPQQVAQELGVRYLLTATVRWEKPPAGASKVHVTPELVEVEPGRAPRSKWAQSLDASLTDVFQVQADIAGQVAQALNVALGDSAKLQLATRATQNLGAYDAFLRGEAVSQGMSVIDPPSLRQAVAAYEQAVALDSTFIQAWARLADAQAWLYWVGTPTPAGAEAARLTAERALALAPTRPEGHHALASYYAFVLRNHPRAFIEDSIALALSPGDAGLLTSVAQEEEFLGRWDEARRHLEQAVRLDPRSVRTLSELGSVLHTTRRYPEARQASDQALALAPTNLNLLELKVLVALGQGDLAGARAGLHAAPKEVDPTALVAFLATYKDLMWVLEERQQQLLLQLTPASFDNDRGTWGIVQAQTYHLRGDDAKARVYADSARRAFEEQLRATPNDPQLRVFFGLALAYLGQKAEAIQEGERAVALEPIAQDAGFGPYIQHQLVRIYLLVGEPEKALDRLEPLLTIPYDLSPGWLRIDPTFAPLKGNPRFERLVAGK